MPDANMKVPDKEANDYFIPHAESDEKKAREIKQRLEDSGLNGQISADILPGVCFLKEQTRLVREAEMVLPLVTINFINDPIAVITKDEQILKNINKPDEGPSLVALFLEDKRKVKKMLNENYPTVCAGLFSGTGFNVNGKLFDKQVDKLKKTIATNTESNPHLQKNGSCVNELAVVVHETRKSTAKETAPENGSDVETSITQDAKPSADAPMGLFLPSPPTVDKKQPPRVSGPLQNRLTHNPQKRMLTENGGSVNDDQDDFQAALGFCRDNSRQTKMVHALGKENGLESTNHERISREECIKAITFKLRNAEKRRRVLGDVDYREADVEKDNYETNNPPHTEKTTNSIGNTMRVAIPA